MHTYIYIYTCSHTFYLSHVAFLSIIMESMSGLLIPCLSGLQNDRPYPDNARSMLEVKVYNSIHPDFLATVHYPMIFPIQISSSHLFPVKLANRPRLQRQPGDPAGARLRHRGSQALGRSQVLGWDKVAWLVGNPK